MKKILSIWLTIAMMMSMCSVAVIAEDTYDAVSGTEATVFGNSSFTWSHEFTKKSDNAYDGTYTTFSGGGATITATKTFYVEETKEPEIVENSDDSEVLDNNEPRKTLNKEEKLFLILGILIVIIGSIFFYGNAKRKLQEVIGENLDIGVDEEDSSKSKKDKTKEEKLKKIRKTIKTLESNGKNSRIFF
jgi:uncharacterized protein YxeA